MLPVDAPICSTPIRQVRSNYHIHRNVGGPELDEQDIILLHPMKELSTSLLIRKV
jgi:hypothetical protein